MEIIKKYFSNFSDEQIEAFSELEDQIRYWNMAVNIVSRKDMDFFQERHLLHSLGIYKVIQFRKGTKVLDVGTGGGLPGLPLAICLPDVSFHLIDSIGKKIKIVDSIIRHLQLKNVTCEQIRAEDLPCSYDFIISRAVTSIPNFLHFTKGKINKQSKNDLKNGILYLKGGYYITELETIHKPHKIFHLRDYYEEEFFKEKDVLYIEIS